MTAYPNHNPVEILDVPGRDVIVGDHTIGPVIDGVCYLGKSPALRRVDGFGPVLPSGTITVLCDGYDAPHSGLRPDQVYRVARSIK